ncbi:MAG: hypothetical protein BHW44_10295 [Roseburia sp. 40_7]|nr:MAG: hypothetical protein BHW44_10295 [Roseburia sp. 40_7]
MKNYEKPIVKLEEEKAEGVYMASGDSIDGNNSGSGCYTVSAYIHQTPEIGREDYRIQVNAHHSASHNCNGQILTLNFNQPVTYQSSGGSLQSGDGTSSIKIKYGYWNNRTDNIGLGDVVVKSNPGLAVTGAVMDDSGYTS